MDITLRDILEHLYEAAYWDGEKGRHDRMEPAVERAEELIEPLRDRGETEFSTVSLPEEQDQ